ncbi:hypothetical protein RSC2_00554 [Bacillus paralicheniformis]|nr:hypothetical protein RSC1_03116 [Bacillus paralicheniformis]BCE08758.1 hypothetical protein RSC2_00554 [Bacillus paralicheniformis]BCE14875.1 hypothetical protein RSC3_02231 [Bacillus paralicheniformis]
MTRISCILARLNPGLPLPLSEANGKQASFAAVLGQPTLRDPPFIHRLRGRINYKR